jgi:probable rRNA maturation factor
MSARRAARAVGAPARRLIVTVTAGRGMRVPAGLAAWIERAAPRSACGHVAIALVGDGRMRALNARFRGVRHATDVLSFPAGDDGIGAGREIGRGMPRADKTRIIRDLGEIAVARGVAARQARAHGHPLGTELRILALHGLLHLLGYDHEHDRGQMRRLEERLLRRAGLTAGLIARAHRRPDARS